MEELLVYAILLYEGLAAENEYNKRLDELFLSTPENDNLFDDLLYLEYETDIKKAIIYVRTHIEYNNLNNIVFYQYQKQYICKYEYLFRCTFVFLHTKTYGISSLY